MSAPFSFDGSFRRGWMTWRRSTAGSYIVPVNFYQYIHMSGTDPSEWKILKVNLPKQKKKPRAFTQPCLLHSPARLSQPILPHHPILPRSIQQRHPHPTHRAIQPRSGLLLDSTQTHWACARPRSPPRPTFSVLRRAEVSCRQTAAICELDGMGDVFGFRSGYGVEPLGCEVQGREDYIPGERMLLLAENNKC